MVEAGYIKEEADKPNKFLQAFDKVTSKIPVVGRLMPEIRLLIAVTLLLLIIVVPVVLLSLP